MTIHTKVAGTAAALVILWLYVGLVLLGVLHNVALLPVWVVLGSSAVAVVILLYLITTAENWGLRRIRADLLLAATVGGVLAIVLGGTIDALIQPTSATGALDDRALLLSGFIEEACKLAVVFLFVRRRADRSPLDGFLLGAAVGLGFATFENMGYAVTPFIDHQFGVATLLQSAAVQGQRALFEPFGHPLWSALLGSVIVVAPHRRHPILRIALAYVGVAVAHGSWDGAAVLGERVLGSSGLAIANTGVWLLTIAEVVTLAVMIRARRADHHRGAKYN
jgi:RsiW-degrading membrane proteinase PrsW (M82 family)